MLDGVDQFGEPIAAALDHVGVFVGRLFSLVPMTAFELRRRSGTEDVTHRNGPEFPAHARQGHIFNVQAALAEQLHIAGTIHLRDNRRAAFTPLHLPNG